MSFTSESRERTQPTIPLSGMIDILFLLLIFFIVTSAMRESETAMEVNLQRTATGKAGAATIATHITVTTEGKIFIAGIEYTVDNLKTKLIEIAKSFPSEPIVIRGDKTSDLGVTVEIMDLCRQYGLNNVAIGSRKKASELR